MLPRFLFSSYKQYKTDSDAVATWLATTAKQCGCPHDLLKHEAPSQQKGPRLKGKARKLAREAAQDKSPSSQSNGSESETASERPKYLIAINDFVFFAEWIAKSTNPRVEVPASFVSVLERAITVRKRHHDWWHKQGQKSDNIIGEGEQSNENHGYFISILEKVREILQCRMPTSLLEDPLEPPVNKVPSSKESTDGHMVNLFENLDIEEPSEGFLNSEPATKEQRIPSAPQVQYGIDEEADVAFAILCLFNDFNNIRNFLQQVWIGYKEGAFDLVTASITTNTAIDFADRLGEDLRETFPEHANFGRQIQGLYLKLCSDVGHDPRFREQSDDDLNFAVYDEAEKMLIPAYMLTSCFIAILQPPKFHTFKPGLFGVYDARSDRASKSSRAKFSEDKTLILEILPDFVFLSVAEPRIPVVDEMARGMRQLILGEDLRILQVFAVQIFLDIHHILREQVSNGFDDLVWSAKCAEAKIKQAMEFLESACIGSETKSYGQSLSHMLDLITNWVKTDAVQAYRTKCTPGFSRDETFVLLRHHPLCCGLLSHHIETKTQEAAIGLANVWNSILSSAQLYNAVRQEKLLSHAWPDMDLALHLHRSEEIFIGDFPRTLEDYPKRFALVMGFSVTNFAKNKRDSRFNKSKTKPRYLNDLAPISQMFMGRNRDRDGRINLSLDDINMILKEYGNKEVDIVSTEARERKTRRIRTHTKNKTPQGSSTGTVPSSKLPKHLQKPQNSAPAGLRMIQFLNAVFNAIQSERPQLLFDHVDLHVTSWRLFRAIRKEIGEDLHHIFRTDLFEKESQLPFMTAHIFQAAVKSSLLDKMLLPRWADIVTNRLLVKSAAVMKEMLESGAGETQVKRLKELGMQVEVPDVLKLAGRAQDINDGPNTDGAQ